MPFSPYQEKKGKKPIWAFKGWGHKVPNFGSILIENQNIDSISFLSWDRTSSYK